ncbi:MAG: hypothetical protein DRO96_00505 [Candidatus Aenigmatarchaeota archaeon]|nr:MAG: hypothetical protein DRO96_00505 [Candidatus Aenigmarchaeota archaeon]
MFSDRMFHRICWIVAVLGVFGLFLVTKTIGPENTEIHLIGEKQIGKRVCVYGNVETISSNSGHVFLTINDAEDRIKVVVFKNAAEKMPFIYTLKNGDIVKVIGKVQKYKGSLEIIGERVEVV